MHAPKALVIGATGLWGSRVAAKLLDRGYIVHAIIRRRSIDNLVRIRHLLGGERGIFPVSADLIDGCSIIHALNEVKPDEVYYTATSCPEQYFRNLCKAMDIAECEAKLNYYDKYNWALTI